MSQHRFLQATTRGTPVDRPGPLIEPKKLRTKADWLDAGRRVFDELDIPEFRTNDLRALKWTKDANAWARSQDDTPDTSVGFPPARHNTLFRSRSLAVGWCLPPGSPTLRDQSLETSPVQEQHQREEPHVRLERRVIMQPVPPEPEAAGGYDRNLIDAKTARKTIHYIHLNPIRRDLAENPEDWYWSSGGL